MSEQMPLTLALLPERFAICRLASEAPVPPLPLGASLVALTLTADELSLVMPQEFAPEGAQMETGWRALRVAGPLDLNLTGVLAALAGPLAQAEVAIFAVSTYDTDYLLVRETALDAALAALRAAGHVIA